MLTPDLDQYFDTLQEHLPDFTDQDQQTALAIYRELSKGHPVTDERLGAVLGVSTAQARVRRRSPAVDSFVYENEKGEILGFGGLAAAPMHHRFEVDGVQLWTWCAWDSLFIPELLGKTAQVISPSPKTGVPIRLTVSPTGVEAIDPATTVVSFLLPTKEFTNGAENVMATFCHFVYFFESEEAGQEWAAEHPGTFLYSVDEAVTLSRRLNRRNFGNALQSNCVYT